MDQRIGTKLGNYHIVKVIDKGAYGVVYRAVHVHLGHPVAIKFIHAYLNIPQQREFFLHEAQTLAKLDHPNIELCCQMSCRACQMSYESRQEADPGGGQVVRILDQLDPQ